MISTIFTLICHCSKLGNFTIRFSKQTGVYKIRPYVFSHTVILTEKEFK